MRFNRKLLRSKGQTLIEVIVIITIGMLIIVALVFATIASLRNSQFAKNQAQATKLAQEGIEWVRIGRDRNRPVSLIGILTVDSWNGTQPLWSYRISGDCDRPDLILPGGCYFNVDSTGQLINIGFAVSSIPSTAEGIPSSSNKLFTRFILLSDDLDHDKNFAVGDDDWQNQKEVTVVIKWNDFSGDHESRLTTILRKL